MSDLMCGYVPVAPVLTETYDKAAYESVRVPTLIIFGEMDTNMGLKSAKNLAQIPTSSKAQVGSYMLCMTELMQKPLIFIGDSWGQASLLP